MIPFLAVNNRVTLIGSARVAREAILDRPRIVQVRAAVDDGSSFVGARFMTVRVWKDDDPGVVPSRGGGLERT